jgi:segregation and condensation protein B
VNKYVPLHWQRKVKYMTHKKLLEAALFISSSPMGLDRLARVSGINSLGHVKELMEELQKDYGGSGLELSNTPGGWVMQVRPELLPKVAHLTPYSDLGEGPKRTLALVTLKEPVRQSIIIRMQGNKAYSYIKDLVKRGLIVSEREGHTKTLKLTQEFERYFGEERAKIREHLQKHLEATSRPEGAGDKAEPEPQQEFLDEKPSKEKARTSAIREGAAREVPKADEFGNDDDDEDEEPESEENEASKETGKESSGQKGRSLRASHGHAFREIE